MKAGLNEKEKTVMSSKYDELHDKYNRIETTKSGTRYERLTALVFKIISATDSVIHDLKLIGASEVKHQIDVIIEKKDGQKKRVLVECKDYDISGDKVGLDIIRNFFGVIEDIRPDEAFVITCNGFTADAQKYAKAKNIKLATVRLFEEKDMEGRIKTILIHLHIQHVTEPKVEILLFDKAKANKIQEDMSCAGMHGFGILKRQPVYINTRDGRYQINEFIENELNAYPKDNPGPVELVTAKENASIEIENRGPVKIDGIKLTFEVLHLEHESKVTSEKVAELIINGFEESDMIIFDEDMKKFKVNEDTGEVIKC